MKTNKKSSNCYNYTTLLAQYPETKELFRVWAEEGSEETVDSDPIPSPEFDLDAAEQFADQVGEEILDQELPEADEKKSDDLLFDVEKIKENVTLNLQAVSPEDIQDEETSEYVLMVDSLGNLKSAREFLNLDQDADQEAVKKAAQEQADKLADAAELPGRFEILIQEQEAEQPLKEDAEQAEDADDAEVESLTAAEEDETEAAEPTEDTDDAEDLITVDVMYIFSDSDIEKLEDAGYSFGQEAEASFEEIMSNLVEAGHRDTARRIYDILYPARRH